MMAPSTTTTPTMLLLLLLLLVAIASAQQTVGDWNVQIQTKRGRLGGERIPLVIFPTTGSSASVIKSKLDCRLSLFQNGTFSLVPQTSDKAAITMPMNGWWELGRNPYCPTDRFYDDLLLESYPRVQKQRDDDILQRVAFQFKCRIYGRHSRNPMKSCRMNHGVLLWKQNENDKPTSLFASWRQRRVCASFTAKPVQSITVTAKEPVRRDDDDDDDICYLDGEE